MKVESNREIVMKKAGLGESSLFSSRVESESFQNGIESSQVESPVFPSRVESSQVILIIFSFSLDFVKHELKGVLKF